MDGHQENTIGWTGAQYIGFEWTLVTSTGVMVAARLYIDIKGIRKLVWYREALVVGAWVLFCAVAALDNKLNEFDWFNIQVDLLAAPMREQVELLKILLAYALLYNIPLLLCQMELLFLFLDLIKPRASNMKIFWLIVFTFFSVSATWLGFFIGTFFNCVPLKEWWTPPSECRIGQNQTRIQIAYTSLWVFNEFLIFLIPTIVVLRMQKMTRSQKLSAAAMFSIGLLNALCGIFTQTTNIISWTLQNWSLYGASQFLYIVHLATAVMLVCMPQMKSCWRILKARKARRRGFGGSIEVVGDVERQGKVFVGTTRVAARDAKEESESRSSST